MRVKTFQGSSTQEVLQIARQDMGQDVVILQVRELTRGGFFGLGARKYVELLAGSDDRRPSPKPSASPVEKVAMEAIAYHQIQALQDEVRQMRSIVNQPRQAQSIPQPQPLEEEMDIITLRKLFAGRTAKPVDGRAVIALIGPTGVGKTTTLAKLAAKYSIEQHKSVAMITLDTFRIGAVEQLRTYARILNVALEVALTPEDLSAAINRHADKDVILIDTVGRCQKNRLQLSELQVFLDVAKPSEVHLVVSASSSTEVQKDVVQKFGALGPNRLIFTKLDEAVGLKCIADVAMSSRLPLSYITNGQNVPDDIERVDPDKLATLVAGVV